MTSKPAWLKKMENGALGEARAKALLLERFWVLERSVDIDGADYLIQRRITTSDFLDRSPPRLGVVQAKFLQDGLTYAKIREDYICDSRGQPHSEFFALIFVGHEDYQRSFLFNSSDILKTFTISELDGIIYYKISGASILGCGNNEIRQLKISLDKIEHALESADFVRNREYLSSSDYIKLDKSQIHPDYVVPLDNTQCRIPEAYHEMRKNIQYAKFEIEEVLEALSEILKETDPLKAIKLYQDKIQPHEGRGGSFGRTIEISLKGNFLDEDYISASKAHIARLMALRSKNIESSFLSLISNYTTLVISKTISHCPNDKQDVLVTATYDPITLEGINVTVALIDADLSDNHSSKVVASELGKQQISYRPSHWISPQYGNGKIKNIRPQSTEELHSCYKERSWKISRPFQREIEILLIGPALVDGWL